MRHYQTYVNMLIFIILIGLSFNTSYNPFLMNHIETFSIQTVSKSDDELYKEVKEKSKLYNEEPEDAYIDKIWKKTPGRNGVKVNIDKSYSQIKKEGRVDKSLLTYEEVSPKVSLNDLSAAPIYRGHPKKDMVAFLINVSWGTEYIPDILTILKEENIKATFFIEGKWAKENAEHVKMIFEEGHVIGNHAYSHPDMARLSNQAILDEINQTNDVIKAIIKEEPKWFAPPSGSFSDHVVDIASNLNMETVLWTVDTIDWKNPSTSVMINRVMKNIHPGATILMHPTSSITNGLETLIKEIKDENYELGTIENLLSEER